MYQYEDNRRKRILEMVSLVKLLSILFCGSIIFSVYAVTTEVKSLLDYGTINMVTSGFFFVVMLSLIYIGWLSFYKRVKIQAGFTLIDIIETLVFMMVFTILIVISGNHGSNYKFIFLFIIITTAIQYPKTYGLTVAGGASLVIIGIDLMAFPKGVPNQYLEADLILSGVFLLTAWLLGDYVKIETSYREKMLCLANIDELTDVYNHRYFQEAITRTVEDSSRRGVSVSLLFIDIDFFKNYNDLYGHMKGDHALSSVAEILKRSTRTQDTVARYGGEEFAVILPNTSEEEAIKIGEGIRKEIAFVKFEGEENLPNKKLTVSIGVSCYPTKAKSKVELINSADDALYRAKFFNKNRVEVYTSILEELKEDIEEEHIDLISSIKTLISVINAKDRYTYGHTERVVIYCSMAADYLGLSEEDKKVLKFGAYLHDIGKIEIPKEILNKKTKLMDTEYKYIKAHPENGVEIIKSVTSLRHVIPLILYHHERFDGKGYPHGLKGEEIPFLTRILSVADSFDAMTSNRPYQSHKTFEEGIVELRNCKGAQFDPEVVEGFIQSLSQNLQQLEQEEKLQTIKG